MSSDDQNSHPKTDTLALFSRGDLPLLEKWKVGRHVARCGACEQEVSRFRFVVDALKREADNLTLTGFEAITDWSRLEREMLGNIAVGVAAARCIDNVGRKRPVWRAAALVGCLLALFVAGWLTHIPRAQNNHLLASMRRLVGEEPPVLKSSPVLETTPDGISVQAQGARLTILHPRSAVISMSSPSSVRARYVDEDSGEVTITSVYGQ